MDNVVNGHENYKTEKVDDNIESEETSTTESMPALESSTDDSEKTDKEIQDGEKDSKSELNISSKSVHFTASTSLEEDEKVKITGLNYPTVEDTVKNVQDDEKASKSEPKSNVAIEKQPAESLEVDEIIKKSSVNVQTPQPNSEMLAIASTSVAADEKNMNFAIHSSESQQSLTNTLNKIEVIEEAEDPALSETTPLLRLPRSSNSENRNESILRIITAVRRCCSARRGNENDCIRFRCYLVPAVVAIAILMFIVRVFFVSGKNSRFNIFRA